MRTCKMLSPSLLDLGKLTLNWSGSGSGKAEVEILDPESSELQKPSIAQV